MKDICLSTVLSLDGIAVTTKYW